MKANKESRVPPREFSKQLGLCITRLNSCGHSLCDKADKAYLCFYKVLERFANDPNTPKEVCDVANSLIKEEGLNPQYKCDKKPRMCSFGVDPEGQGGQQISMDVQVEAKVIGDRK
ncbi:15779_t:CDS:2 [Gigaspora margarita]|uniref:15779_t:CDS:1 n=1 Tax=Gigaspora margarita TaxID=4874 RepID=A0ABN7WB55_GIGMA|nr:15779_t:CDS:2 [Gigaspora margarita]